MARQKHAAADGERRDTKPTRDALLDAAGELLAEVGVERISTNMICQRAGVTPPALYHYFADKFEVIEALGSRLMDRQNEVLIAWIGRHAGKGLEAYAESLEAVLRETVRVTDSEPGGVWIERALHATPKLAHIRMQSHRYVTDKLTEAFAPMMPQLSRDQVWLRMRTMVEFGYVTTELLHAETDQRRDAILAEAARMQRHALLDTRPTALGPT